MRGGRMMFMWILLPILLMSLFSCGTSIQRRPRKRAEDESGNIGRGPNVQSQIFGLAKRLGGTITVSDVVVDMGLPVRDAEALLETLTDGVRVRMDVGGEGIVRYVFAEFARERQLISSGEKEGETRGD